MLVVDIDRLSLTKEPADRIISAGAVTMNLSCVIVKRRHWDGSSYDVTKEQPRRKYDAFWGEGLWLELS